MVHVFQHVNSMAKFIVFNTLAQAEDYARRRQKPFKHGDVSDPEQLDLLAIFFVVDKKRKRVLCKTYWDSGGMFGPHHPEVHVDVIGRYKRKA